VAGVDLHLLTDEAGTSTPLKAVSAPEAPVPEDLLLDLGALRRRGVDRHRVECELPADWIRAALGDTDATVERSGRVGLDVLLQSDGTVLAKGSLELSFFVPCGRCLETFVKQGHEAHAPEPAEDDEGLGLVEDDLDVWVYDGQSLPLHQVVGESIKLAYPMRALCPRGEACRGLCSNCGAALNEQPLGRQCAACGAELEGIALGDLPEASSTEGPLADALRKLDLPD
jgi:uncharacterized metal-binding protein YceD (DUF177 family)